MEIRIVDFVVDAGVPAWHWPQMVYGSSSPARGGAMNLFFSLLDGPTILIYIKI